MNLPKVGKAVGLHGDYVGEGVGGASYSNWSPHHPPAFPGPWGRHWDHCPQKSKGPRAACDLAELSVPSKAVAVASIFSDHHFPLGSPPQAAISCLFLLGPGLILGKKDLRTLFWCSGMQLPGFMCCLPAEWGLVLDPGLVHFSPHRVGQVCPWETCSLLQTPKNWNVGLFMPISLWPSEMDPCHWFGCWA